MDEDTLETLDPFSNVWSPLRSDTISLEAKVPMMSVYQTSMSPRQSSDLEAIRNPVVAEPHSA